MRFQIDKNIYDSKTPLYDNSELELLPGVTCLIGINGAGKSTLIAELETECKKASTPFISVDNYHDGGDKYLGSNEISAKSFAHGIWASEGQRILVYAGDMAQKLGKFTREHNDEDNVIAIDAIDSGLDLYNIEKIRGLLKLITEDSPKSHIVVAGNTFDITEGFRCIDVKTFEEIDVSTYEKFKEYILAKGKK